MSIKLNLKNYHLEGIFKGLNYPNQNFQIGRSKMRIVKLLEEKSKITNASRLEMLHDLCQKDEKGKPVMKNVMVQVSPTSAPVMQNQYDLGENTGKFQEEFKKMMDEECIIEIPDSLKNDFSVFKGLLANSQAQNLTDSEIMVIDEVLEEIHKDDKKVPDGPVEQKGHAPKNPKK